MALVQLQCPNCNSIDVIKYGTLPTEEQRYFCNNPNCEKKTSLKLQIQWKITRSKEQNNRHGFKRQRN